MNALKLVACVLLILQPGPVHGENYTTTVQRILHQLCPYTDSCSHNASKTLRKDESACCLQCFCGAACEVYGNCCLDYNHTANAAMVTQLEPCLSVFEDADASTEPDPMRSNGVKDGIHYYHTVVSCPSGFGDQQIIDKCTSAVPLYAQDVVRVSDKTGRVYKNRNCAICNGVTDYITWQLQILYSKFNHVDGFTELNILSLLDSGYMIASVPPTTNAALLYRCFKPDITACNQTGKWKVFDKYINMACNSFTNIYVVDDRPNTVFKNPFCYFCNQNNIEHANGICKYRDYGRSPKTSFAALINIESRKARFGSLKGYKCQIDEILDPYLGVCKRLLCPWTKYPVYGHCLEQFTNTHGMAITFQIAINISYPNTTATATVRELLKDEDTASMLADAYFKNVGHSECRTCKSVLFVFVEGHPGVEHLFLAKLVTNEHCSVNGMFAVMRDNLERKSFQMSVVNVDLVVSTKMVFLLQSYEGPSQVRSSTYHILHNRVGCMSGVLVADPKFYCPHIELSNGEYLQYTARNIGAHNVSSANCCLAKANTMPGNDNETVHMICIEDYLEQRTDLKNTATICTRMSLLLALQCFVMVFRT